VAKRTKPPGIPAEGAKPSGMPGFIKPQLAKLKSKAPKGEQWLHEI
jgi:bifunctional non-homologous end joining protein LigD